MAQIDFSGKTVLLAGGSAGIGNAAARAFLSAGATVHVTGTRDQASDYTGTDGVLDGMVYHRLDLGDGADIDALAAAFPALDVLVVAGARVDYQRREFERQVFRRNLLTNLAGPMQLAEALRPAMAGRGAAVVMVGSVASFRGVIGQPAYSAAKGGLLTLTRSLAQAYARDGIRVNLVAPGLVRTKMTAITWEQPERAAATAAAVPLKRLGEPDDLAGPILFLASDAAAYVTGTSLIVDGGLTA